MMSIHWALNAKDEINDNLISHFTYDFARGHLLALILFKKGGECILITGPSRVGKSYIAEALVNYLNIEENYEPMVQQPVVLLTCKNNGERAVFSAKSFFLAALKKLNHPLFVDEADIPENDIEHSRRQTRITTSALEEIFEKTLKTLKTKYLVIDEMQHLKYMNGGGKSALQMMEYFKALAEDLKVVLIFVGAYPILTVLDLSPHLLGRTSSIHMRRYNLIHDVDRARYREILRLFGEELKYADSKVNLQTWETYLYDGSFGLIGILSSWVRDAMANMAARGDDTLKLNHFEETRKPQIFLDKIWSEIELGEKYLSSKENVSPGIATVPKNKKEEKVRKRKNRPFQAKTERRGIGERV